MITLGLSYSGQHDSSIAIYKNGKIIFAMSEERVSRINHDHSFPIRAIEAGLDYTGLAYSEIDNVCLGWDGPVSSLFKNLQCSEIKNLTNIKSNVNFLVGHLKNFYTHSGLNTLFRKFGNKPFFHCNHHLAHAISAYSFSPFDQATVLVIDGRGACESTTIWKAENNSLIPVKTINWPNSLGLLYAKFTKYLGFQPLSDEWKVMGLAAYGNTLLDTSNLIDLSKDIYQINKNLLGNSLVDVSLLEKLYGPSRKDGDEITAHHKNAAYTVQHITEKAILNLTRYSINLTGNKNLCLAGGVAMNCKANGMIASSGLIEGIFIQPAASDEGVSLGAALYPSFLKNKVLPKLPLEDPYLGLGFSDSEIEETINKYKIPFEKLGANRGEIIAKEIANGKVIGHFNKRMEFGPRALGNRSILADPRKEETKIIVNNCVKYREDWRPFAPSIMEEHYHEFFNSKHLSPFMILSFPVKEDAENKILGATHVDHTGRPQTVNKEINPDYWNLINEFYKLTGVPVLVNTSFNLKGEPIVCTPTDAIRTFYSSGLDVLILGNYLVRKKLP